jgi:phospholipase/carboxylesterase
MESVDPVAVWRCGSCENRRGALVVLLHGRGADERNIFPLEQLIPAEAAVAALRGPLRYGEGFAWYENGAPGVPDAASLDHAVAYLERWLDERAGDVEEIWLAGFSAGAAVAGAALLRSPQRYAGAVLMHGAIAPTGAQAPGALRGVPVFYGFGTSDAVIPPERIAATRAYLRDESGALLEEHAYDAAHEILFDEQRDFARWFAARLTPHPQETLS